MVVGDLTGSAGGRHRSRVQDGRVGVAECQSWRCVGRDSTPAAVYRFFMLLLTRLGAVALIMLALSACTSQRLAPWNSEQSPEAQPPPVCTARSTTSKAVASQAGL